jgi:hypothetical protein
VSLKTNNVPPEAMYMNGSLISLKQKNDHPDPGANLATGISFNHRVPV